MATLTCVRASRTRDFSFFLLPLRFATVGPLHSPELASARRRNCGDLITVPSDKTAKAVSPRSIPTSVSVGRNRPMFDGWDQFRLRRSRSTGPAASLTTVTDDGSDGSSRDQRTSMSPTFGSRSLPSGKILNRALAVNLTA